MQSLNEKTVFGNKLEQRENVIQTSKRMRLAEEKGCNDMFEWKTKYNNLQETSQRIINEING